MMRQHIFRLLYNLGFYGEEEYSREIAHYLDVNGIEDEQERRLITDKTLAVMDRRAQYDAMIDGNSPHWKSARIAKVDMAIIRLALYEILEDDQIPTGVAINEAVRLAKKFSSDQAPSFVNGVLAAFVPEETEES